MICPLGDVVDVSSTGLRIITRGKCPVRKGDVISISLSSNGFTLALSGQVVRMNKKLFGPAELGIRFSNLSPGQTKALLQLAQFGFVRMAGEEPGASASSGGSSATGAGPSGGTPGGSGRGPSGGGEPGPGGAAPSIRAGVAIEDLYEVLGIRGDASDEVIREAFRELAKKYHPDHNSDPEAAAKFALISKAYSVLRDPKLRARYDVMLARSLAA